MRLSAVLLVLSLLGVVAGAVLVGRWAVGCAVVFDSLCVGVWALLHDDGQPVAPQVHDAPTLAQVLERARAW